MSHWAWLSAAGASQGAEALPSLTTLEEVIITAQFPEETLKTVPVAITALDADQLRVRGLDTLHDLTSTAPNTVITRGTQTFGPGAQIFIRGVGQIDGHPGFEPGVGVYVDDVYNGVVLGSDFELSDSRVDGPGAPWPARTPSAVRSSCFPPSPAPNPMLMYPAATVTTTACSSTAPATSR